MIARLVLLMTAFSLVASCAVAKVAGTTATLPAKAAWKGTKVAGQGVYYAGKGVYYTGKGVYYVGRVPVQFTNAALDTTSKMLTVTTQAVDLTGKVFVLTNVVAAESLEQELTVLDTTLKAAKNVKKIVSVTVDVAEEIEAFGADDAVAAPL